MSDNVICNCFSVTEDTIIKAIKDGATTVEEVGNVTKAGTACGACLDQIQSIIDANK